MEKISIKENKKIHQVETDPVILSPFSEDFESFLIQKETPLFAKDSYNLLSKDDEYILFTNIIRLRGALIYYNIQGSYPHENLLIDQNYWSSSYDFIDDFSKRTIMHTYDRIRNILFQYNRGLIINFSENHDFFTIDDRIQEGSTGLLRSIRDFDPYDGNKFSTYAYYWIKQRILRMSFNDRTIQIPQNQYLSISKYRDIETSLNQKYDKQPTFEEIIQYSKIHNISLGSTKYLKDALLISEIGSFDSHINNQQKNESWYSITSSKREKTENQAFKKILSEQFRNTVIKICEDSRFKPRDIHIFLDKFGLQDDGPYTFNQLSEKYEISPQRGQKIVSNIMKTNKRRFMRMLSIFSDDYCLFP